MDPGATSVKGVAAPAWARLRDWLRLVLVGLGISVVPLDTAVNIAFPDITGSFGVASFPMHGFSIEDIIRVADAGMYAAKHEGGIL